jgi:hypothetical protein
MLAESLLEACNVDIKQGRVGSYSLLSFVKFCLFRRACISIFCQGVLIQYKLQCYNSSYAFFTLNLSEHSFLLITVWNFAQQSESALI